DAPERSAFGPRCDGTLDRRVSERPLRFQWALAAARSGSGAAISSVSKEDFMIRIAIIIGSTRPGRNGEAVAKWVYKIAQKRTDAEFELVDIKDFNLPLLDEAVPPVMGQYSKPHTKTWAAKIGSFDAYVFVTPEYNHGTSGALKNAIDFLFAEWNNKAAGFVSYGSAGGARAVEHLRLNLAEVQMATVRNQVLLSL